ncbi:hypothetical protein ACFE04_004200 [Oxalis oulophora]
MGSSITLVYNYVHSCQIYLWNHAASMRVHKSGHDKVMLGDLVYCKEDNDVSITSGIWILSAEAELISSIVTFFKRIGISSSDVGFKVSSRKVLQEVLTSYSISDESFGKVCIIIDKVG